MNSLNLAPAFDTTAPPLLDEKIDKDIAQFKKEHGITMIIAFSGGADTGLSDEAPDEVKAYLEQRMLAHVREATRYLSDYRIALLSGGTRFGVPAAAVNCAKEAGIPTIGVYPNVGAKHALSKDLLDLPICVGPKCGDSAWGDESPVFAKLLDGVIVYGGGAGTLIEAAHILKCNENLVKNRQRPKFLVPISGSGGTADILPYFSGKVEVRALCMPHRAINSGHDAAEFLENRLNLFDYRKEV